MTGRCHDDHVDAAATLIEWESEEHVDTGEMHSAKSSVAVLVCRSLFCNDLVSAASARGFSQPLVVRERPTPCPSRGSRRCR
jgi:hypothetical protein